MLSLRLILSLLLLILWGGVVIHRIRRQRQTDSPITWSTRLGLLSSLALTSLLIVQLASAALVPSALLSSTSQQSIDWWLDVLLWPLSATTLLFVWLESRASGDP
jgi:hypothetical protein